MPKSDIMGRVYHLNAELGGPKAVIVRPGLMKFQKSRLGSEGGSVVFKKKKKRLDFFLVLFAPIGIMAPVK